MRKIILLWYVVNHLVMQVAVEKTCNNLNTRAFFLEMEMELEVCKSQINFIKAFKYKSIKIYEDFMILLKVNESSFNTTKVIYLKRSLKILKIQMEYSPLIWRLLDHGLKV